MKTTRIAAAVVLALVAGVGAANAQTTVITREPAETRTSSPRRPCS